MILADRSKNESTVSTLTDPSLRPVTETHDQKPVAPQPPVSTREEAPKEETTKKSAPALPHSWDELVQPDKQSDMAGSNNQDTHPDRSNTPLPQSAALPSLNAQGTGGAHAETTFALGTVIQPMPRSIDAHQTPPVPAPPPVVAEHDLSNAPIPALSRSVVFEVAQPDLGRVNVRVALTNDVVHAHLSSDRPEVGQYLLNGQDRLQTALQASGLDMGQFRVHVERQFAQHGGQEGLSRGYEERSQQQRGHERHQDQGTDALSNDRQRAGVLSLFA